MPTELWLRIFYAANKDGKFVRRMATFGSTMAAAARQHEDNDKEAGAELDAKVTMWPAFASSIDGSTALTVQKWEIAFTWNERSMSSSGHSRSFLPVTTPAF